jgi:hypothetical protein
MRNNLHGISMTAVRFFAQKACAQQATRAGRVRMDRNKFTISVVPDSSNRASNGPRIVPDQSAEWDAKWLHPKLAAAKPIEHAKDPEPMEDAAPEEQESDPLTIRFLRWLFPDVNQRRAKRYPTPGVVAYYWTGGAPYSYQVGDMSATGLFLLTKERWAPGTLIQMTLQRQDGRINNSDSSICVLSEVVRWSDNGAGFNFILSDYDNVLDYGIQPAEAVDRKSIERFLKRVGVPHSR